MNAYFSASIVPMPHPVHPYFRPYWYGIFFNPFFLTRKGLFQAIKKNSHYIKGKVLDFGCGNKPYAAVFDTDQYTGLDYDTEISRKNLKQGVDVLYDGRNIPFADEHFDSAFSSEVLEHVFNPEEILAEIHRVLKPGGHLLLSCPFFWPEHEQPYDYARYTSFGLKHLIEKHGFEMVHYQKTGSYFECLLQGWVLYLFFFIPHKPKVLEVIFFSIFITPVLATGLLLAALLPQKIKRSDFYLNNVVIARKKAATEE